MDSRDMALVIGMLGGFVLGSVLTLVLPDLTKAYRRRFKAAMAAWKQG